MLVIVVGTEWSINIRENKNSFCQSELSESLFSYIKII
jgi:hypothetical protein